MPLQLSILDQSVALAGQGEDAAIRDTLALAEHAEHSARTDVHVGYEGPAEGAIAICDGALVRQVVWNLVKNGMQVSPPNSTVLVTVRTVGSEIELCVRDAGPGVTAAQRDVIFDAFYTTRTHGAGLGLAVVKRIMSDHASMGGRIEVDADAGAGVFRLYFRAVA